MKNNNANKEAGIKGVVKMKEMLSILERSMNHSDLSESGVVFMQKEINKDILFDEFVINRYNEMCSKGEIKEIEDL